MNEGALCGLSWLLGRFKALLLPREVWRPRQLTIFRSRLNLFGELTFDSVRVKRVADAPGRDISSNTVTSSEVWVTQSIRAQVPEEP